MEDLRQNKIDYLLSKERYGFEDLVLVVEVLRGEGPEDLRTLSVALAAGMLHLAGRGDYESCAAAAERALTDGSALAALANMVKAQGGDPQWVYHTELFPRAPFERAVCAPADGYIVGVDTEGYGRASLLLGAGRNTKEDTIDLAAGIRLLAKTGDLVKKGEAFAILYAERESLLDAAETTLLSSTRFGAEKPMERPLIFGKIQ